MIKSTRKTGLYALLLASAACTDFKPLPSSSAFLPPLSASAAAPVFPAVRHDALKTVSYADLPGWNQDDLRQAWPAFLASCAVLKKYQNWKVLCSATTTVDVKKLQAVRLFFENFFTPYQVINLDGTAEGLMTGYYEPLLKGSRQRGGKYQSPLYRVPNDLLTIDLSALYPELKNKNLRGRLVAHKIVPYASRAEITQRNLLAGQELVWLDNPMDAFFLQIQGSGKIQLPSGEMIRLSYADHNGHPYRSIGSYLIQQGEMTTEQASAKNIQAWGKAHPARQQTLLNINPRYIFFKEEKITDSKQNPNGALGVPLTPERSIAIDTQFLPLGAPVFLASSGSREILQRLVMAQDKGEAIKNPVRADYFWGGGQEAGEKAGRMKQKVKMWVLLPKNFINAN